MDENKNLRAINYCKKVVDQYRRRTGDSIYVSIERNGKYEVLDINSEDLYNFMSYKMYNDDIVLNRRVWDSTIRIMKGSYSKESLLNKHTRIGKVDGAIYYDVLNMQSSKQHFIKVTETGWNIIDEDVDAFEWNIYQSAQVLPLEGNGEYTLLLDYLKNVKDEERLLYMVYLISCFIPDIQHPILNITGEAGTGKSTLCEITKSLVDPSKAVLNDFSDGEDGIIIPLSKNYLTVFDNIEKIPAKLNETFCRAVTGGETMKRKLFTNNEMVAIPLNSIVVMNGISPAIRREDLMTRTIFIKTEPIKSFEEHSKLLEDFYVNKPVILGGIFDILSKAMHIKDSVKITANYRMKEFASWGYAIAEAMEFGLGKKFLECLKRNERIQMEENYANEPLIPIILRFAAVNKNITLSMGAAYEKFIEDGGTYYDGDLGSFAAAKRYLPKSAASLGKKMRSLKSVFEKCDVHIEFGTTGDIQHLSTITIEKMEKGYENKCVCYQKDVAVDIINRIPIIGIRKPITNVMG